jgi:flagellar protein FlaI
MRVIGRYYRLLDKYLPEGDVTLIEELGMIEDEEVIEDYWVYRPFVKAEIVKILDSEEMRYRVMEPTLTVEEFSVLEELYKDIGDVLILKDLTIELEAKEKILLSTFKDLIREYGVELDSVLQCKYIYYLFRDFLGFGPIDAVLNDPYVEDIHCDGYDIPIYLNHKKYGNIATDIRFSEEELDKYVQALVQMSGKHVSHGNPIIDATLPDGSRLQATYGVEVTPRGSSFTIRKFTEEPLTPVDLIRFGTYTAEQLAYFWLVVEHKLNLMVVGETAAGKTTTLNAILMFLPPEAKVVSIEDTREIALKHENWIAGVTREAVTGDEREISMYDLLRAALRQRPDYIVVGEVRGKEAQTLFQAMSTGHAAYATLHAGDIHQTIYRLETEPLNVPRSLIQFLDVISIQTQWTREGIRKRRVKNVYEILGIDPNDKNLLINEVYRWNPYTDEHYPINPLKKLEKISIIRGEDVGQTMEELNRRAEFLEFLNKLDIRDLRSVTSMIHAYYRNPFESFDTIMKEGRKYEKAEAKA